jgi:hypothetical protein
MSLEKKINETLVTIQSGARNNKYRVVYPSFGREIDIVCNATSAPGREVGTVEVFCKGRKYQMAGEITDDGTWEMTIYNTPELLHRRFFLELLQGIHSFEAPAYLNAPGYLEGSDLNDNNITASGEAAGGGAKANFSDFLGNLNTATRKVVGAYNDVTNAVISAKRLGSYIKQAVNGDWSAVESILTENGYSTPWYMQEVIIEQLDHNEVVSSRTILHNCFVTSVGPIEYTDEVGEVSVSNITFSFSGIEFTGGPILGVPEPI